MQGDRQTLNVPCLSCILVLSAVLHDAEYFSSEVMHFNLDHCLKISYSLKVPCCPERQADLGYTTLRRGLVGI